MSGLLCLWTLLLQGFVTPLEEIRFTAVFEQHSDYSCGIASLSSLVSLYWGYDGTEDELLRILTGADPNSMRETITFHDLLFILESLGFAAGGFTLTYDQLVQAAMEYGPLIVHLGDGEGHFVLFLGTSDGYVVIGDPSRGLYAGSRDEFLDSWTKTALAAYYPQRVLDYARAGRAINTAGGRIEILSGWVRK